jgi:hypothetical protein
MTVAAPAARESVMKKGTLPTDRLAVRGFVIMRAGKVDR